MEQGVERLAAMVLLLTCLSHIAAPNAWAELFRRIDSSGDLAGILYAAIHLPLGLMIVAFHDVWSWPEIVVTLIGWALLLKGTLHLLIPSLARRSIALAADPKRYRLGGLLMLPLALAVGWIALR
ncbi:MAG TPA: hypothetical protein VM308_00355 [Sphingomicrobium sp.]|nr:hypothetical protein [Sphingomicrobium sp.]